MILISYGLQTSIEDGVFDTGNGIGGALIPFGHDLDNYTISIEFSTLDDVGQILSLSNYDEDDNEILGLRLTIYDSKLYYLHRAPMNDYVDMKEYETLNTSSKNVTNDTWIHAVIVKKGDVITLYSDGYPYDKKYGFDDIDMSSLELRIGCNSHNIYSFKGKIKNIKIYNYALPYSEAIELSAVSVN